MDSLLLLASAVAIFLIAKHLLFGIHSSLSLIQTAFCAAVSILILFGGYAVSERYGYAMWFPLAIAVCAVAALRRH